jgi:alpha-D-xyloside xylohydrolase
MDLRDIGIIRALGWDRLPDGAEFRGVTTGLAAARIAVRAVAPRVVRVRITPGPIAPAKGFSYVTAGPTSGRVQLEEASGTVTLRTEHLTVEVALEPWRLTFRTAEGRLLTHEVSDDVNFAAQRLGPPPGFLAESLPHDPLRRAMATVETLLLDPDDHFYGGGERFTRLDHVGRTLRTWNRNSYGARSEHTYKTIPLVVGTRGYGLFVDVPTAVSFHLGSRSNRTLTLEAAGPELDYYLLAGSPKEILGAYADLTGKPAVPPAWAFGLWASTGFVAYTEASLLEQARRLRAEAVPCDVFHLDCFWQRAHMWCDFEWDTARMPDPKRLLTELRRLGFRNCLWINPYVSVQSALYREGAERGYFLRRPDGSIYAPIVWNQRSERGMGLCAIVDFSHPEAARWYAEKLEAQLALGADCFKPDFAEEIPEDARFANGLTGAEMHNPYALLYQRTAWEATLAHKGEGETVAWSRSAAPGVQRYPGHWSGDPECTFVDLANNLRGGLAAAMSGLAYWSHDIGGFWGEPTPELYVRWAQVGLFSALSRYHGATPRDPWLFGDEALAIFRRYARLRSRLIPYLQSLGAEAAATGVPLMRPMVLEFPDDPAARAFDLQYCLGRELLVSPVVQSGGEVVTYLPRGRWTDWWRGTVHEGPTTLVRRVALEELPLFVRENSLVVLGPERLHVGERPADPLTVEAFVTTEARFALAGEAGRIDLTCRREATGLIFEASAAPATWELRLRETPVPASATADGQPLPRLDGAALAGAERGWTMDGGGLVVKARARMLRISPAG